MWLQVMNTANVKLQAWLQNVLLYIHTSIPLFSQGADGIRGLKGGKGEKVTY